MCLRTLVGVCLRVFETQRVCVPLCYIPHRLPVHVQIL